MNRISFFAVPVLAAVSVLACDREPPQSPADIEPARIALALEFPASLDASAGGIREAYRKSNRLWFRFRSGPATRELVDVGFQPIDGETRVPALVRLHGLSETLQFEVEVRRANDAVFRGTTSVLLRAGEFTEVTATLQPVMAAVVAPAEAGPMQAYGDTIRLAAAAVFVTGDTISGVPITWSTNDTQIVTVASDGVTVARSDGVARAVARAGTFEATTLVRVLATAATVRVTPALAQVPVGSTVQFTASALDRRGNPLPPRTISWSSSNPSILAVDATGRVRGMGIGNATIIATITGSTGSGEAQGVPAAPGIDGPRVTITAPGTAVLDADVFPNGGETGAWFEWGAAAAGASGNALTLRQNLGRGVDRVPLGATLQNLLPNTRYVVRVVATNSAGTTTGETVTFTTPAIRPTVKTELAAGVSDNQATLHGSVNPHGSTTSVWFQWGTDAMFAKYDSTVIQTKDGHLTSGITAVIGVPSPNTTYFFRIVARNQAGTSIGEVLSFRSLPPINRRVPLATTLGSSGVGHNTATLIGQVFPGGFDTTVRFEWGTDPTLSTFSLTPASTLTGGVTQSFQATLTGLTPNTTYYFRSFASSAAGTDRGTILSFTTTFDPSALPPAVSTDSASAFDEYDARVHGTANPNRAPTTAWFEWSNDATFTSFSSTTPQAIGAGTSPVQFSFEISNALAGGRLYYRAVASNAVGVTRGTILSFGS